MLKLLLITNNPEEATLWDRSGVDFIFIDLELIGKEIRQGHLNTVISRHTVEDISLIKLCLKRSKLLVRINPLNEETKHEVDDVISRGADVIMLPMFKSANEVITLLEYVQDRCEVYPLLETPEALSDIENLVNIKAVSGYHIGLNDLHLARGDNFMFEVMLSSEFQYAIKTLQESKKIFGIGGVSRLGGGDLPAELILREHYRLGSSRVILSRNFKEEVEGREAANEIAKVKQFYTDQAGEDLSESKILFREKIIQIAERIGK
jgi:hypothetical protein